MSENSIALVIAENPVLALTDKEKFAEFLKDIKAEIDAFVPDVTTPKGRAEIGSLAYKVTRSKTAIDKAGKELNAVKRKEIDAVDAERREIWARLEALADEVRKPLTEWEESEEARRAKIKEDNDYIAVVVYLNGIETSEGIQIKLDALNDFQPDAEVHQDEFTAILAERQAAIDKLQAALDAALQREKDAAELAELRAEKERRDQAEAERLEKEATERAERERIAAEEQAEKDRVAAEAASFAKREDNNAESILDYIKNVRSGLIGGQPYPFGVLLRELEIKIDVNEYAERHRDRISSAISEAHTHLTAAMERQNREAADAEKLAAEQAEKRRQQEIADAAEKAQREEREKAQKEQAERDRVSREAIDKANREAEELRQKEEARLASERAKKAAQEARDRDRKHRGEIMKAAKEAMMSLGADEETAKKIVLAIVAGEIPNTRITF